MSDRIIHMRVKIRSLAEEARIIRNEEKKAKKRGLLERCHGLHQHRTDDLRRCARHNLLAYGYLRGRSYREMEPNARREPEWDLVKRHAKAFCDEWDEAAWKAWLRDALTEESQVLSGEAAA